MTMNVEPMSVPSRCGRSRRMARFFCSCRRRSSTLSFGLSAFISRTCAIAWSPAVALPVCEIQPSRSGNTFVGLSGVKPSESAVRVQIRRSNARNARSGSARAKIRDMVPCRKCRESGGARRGVRFTGLVFAAPSPTPVSQVCAACQPPTRYGKRVTPHLSAVPPGSPAARCHNGCPGCSAGSWSALSRFVRSMSKPAGEARETLCRD